MIPLLNWFSQVASITLVNLRTLAQRKGSALAAAVGIAGVVAVLVGVLSIAEGFRYAMKPAGADDIALVLRSGADSEMTSGLSREDTQLIADAPGLARDEAGPLASPELFVIINLPKRSTGTDVNIPLRGVGPAAFTVRDEIRLIAGRRFQTGRNEVVVGASAARAFAGLDVGHTIRVGANDWEIVGVFTAGGGVAESEIWADAAVLQPAYHRGNSFQSVLAKLRAPEALQEFKDALEADPRVRVKVMSLREFNAEHSSLTTTLIRTIGVTVASLMTLGALFGALNTMYGSVSARTREIATLRALGFGSGAVVCSVLIESIALALAGGILGAGAAYFAFNGFEATTINWQTFSQVAFAFRVTPPLLVAAIVLAVTIGLLGGLFPAIRAARMPVALALRET